MRGAQQDDEWQKIPDDWLADDKNAKTGLESDGEASELTELSDEDGEEGPEEDPEEDQKEEAPEKEEEEPALPKADFIEWETVSLLQRISPDCLFNWVSALRNLGGMGSLP